MSTLKRFAFLIVWIAAVSVTTIAAADTTYHHCGCTIIHHWDGTWSLNCDGLTVTYGSGYTLADLKFDACKGR